MTHPGPSAVHKPPELGPLLGALAAPPMSPRWGALGCTIEDVRLELVSTLFDAAGSARAAHARGDVAAVRSALGAEVWIAAWRRVLERAAERITVAANAGFRAAAASARFPARRRTALFLTAVETQDIAARLGRSGATLALAISRFEELEEARPAGTDDGPLWQEALAGVARRLEPAWRDFEHSVEQEQREWAERIGRVHDWRRPWWPFAVGSAAAIAVASYLGLVLGGYLPVPENLRGVVQAVWRLGV